MQPPVLGELALPEEALAALPTAKRPLSSVQTQVLLQVGLVPERLATLLGAREGTLSRVDFPVSDQAAPQVKALLALTAPEPLLHTAQHLGPRGLSFPSGFVFVFWTFRGSSRVLGVAPSVLYQVVLYMEDFPAEKAGVQPWPGRNFQV